MVQPWADLNNVLRSRRELRGDGVGRWHGDGVLSLLDVRSRQA